MKPDKEHSSPQERPDRDLTEALQFQALLARITAKFVELPAEEMDQAIHDALQQVGEYFDVDRVVLARMTPEGKVLSATHFWHSEEFDAEAAAKYARDQTYPNTAELLLSEGYFVQENAEDYPDWKQPEAGMMKRLGIKAFAVVKISFDGSVMEMVPLDSLHIRSWPNDIVERVQFIGGVLFNAVERKRMELERLKAFEEIKTLKEQLEAENVVLREDINSLTGSREIIGQSDALQETLSAAAKVADSETTVLLTGDTGTGKELVARMIHGLSGRKERPMVRINCGAIPESLVESELFGREEGAYTGALTKQIGRFELAHRSTILLDEVAELPSDLQVKLLRVLEEGEFERLGSPQVIKTDVRVIAATNRDLKSRIQQGKFREDLFYRLNVFPIRCPPLRERRSDIQKPELSPSAKSTWISCSTIPGQEMSGSSGT
jgi:transcriptional regulator with GAF, ATPase, and Fis domain